MSSGIHELNEMSALFFIVWFYPFSSLRPPSIRLRSRSYHCF